VVAVDFSGGFKVPEMVKRRLCIVISPPISERVGLCTVVPLSTTSPQKIMQYHCEVNIPFELPAYWGSQTRWVKGDMVSAVSFERVELLRLGKDIHGKRLYQKSALSKEEMARVIKCVLSSFGV
jgi:uncharacterized protein YifN (PemK superfamily)